jgi:hypothetical protein
MHRISDLEKLNVFSLDELKMPAFLFERELIISHDALDGVVDSPHKR